MGVWSNLPQGLVMGADAVQEWVPAEPGGEVLVSLQLLRAAAAPEYAPVTMWGQPHAHDGLEVASSPPRRLAAPCRAGRELPSGAGRTVPCTQALDQAPSAANKAAGALFPPTCPRSPRRFEGPEPLVGGKHAYAPAFRGGSYLASGRCNLVCVVAGSADRVVLFSVPRAAPRVRTVQGPGAPEASL
jgi:hypothetical protein